MFSLDYGEKISTRTLEMSYDRVERTENGETTLLTFSAGLSVREYLVNGQGTPELQVEFIRGSDYGGGIGGILYSLRGGIPSYAHYNRRGDVVARTDESGSLTYQAAYEAFGRHGDTPGTEEWGDSPDRQRANTKEEDPTGLLNEGFRYRCLETGVFLTRDPLGFVDGPNVYTYVVQNPWTYFDPLGLKAEEESEKKFYKQEMDLSCAVATCRNMMIQARGINIPESALRENFSSARSEQVHQQLIERGLREPESEPNYGVKIDWELRGGSNSLIPPVLSMYSLESRTIFPEGETDRLNQNQIVKSLKENEGMPMAVSVLTPRGPHSIMIKGFSVINDELYFDVVDPGGWGPTGNLSETYAFPENRRASDLIDSLTRRSAAIQMIKNPN